MNRSVLWRFVGAGFVAPIDWRIALAAAGVWCFAVAFMTWGNYDPSGE